MREVVQHIYVVELAKVKAVTMHDAVSQEAKARSRPNFIFSPVEAGFQQLYLVPLSTGFPSDSHAARFSTHSTRCKKQVTHRQFFVVTHDADSLPPWNGNQCRDFPIQDGKDAVLFTSGALV